MKRILLAGLLLGFQLSFAAQEPEISMAEKLANKRGEIGMSLFGFAIGSACLYTGMTDTTSSNHCTSEQNTITGFGATLIGICGIAIGHSLASYKHLQRESLLPQAVHVNHQVLPVNPLVIMNVQYRSPEVFAVVLNSENV